MENQPKIIEIEFIEHIRNFIPKSDMVGFDPDTYGWDSPVVDDNVICWDEKCQKLG